MGNEYLLFSATGDVESEVMDFLREPFFDFLKELYNLCFQEGLLGADWEENLYAVLSSTESEIVGVTFMLSCPVALSHIVTYTNCGTLLHWHIVIP